MPASHTSLSHALIGGAVGATTLTLIHQLAKRLHPEAPRIDAIGRRAVAIGLKAIGVTPPEGDALQTTALVGDLVSNTLYYALVALGPTDDVIERGGILGAVGGIGTLALPPLLGLGREESSGTPARAIMTLAWYLAGGLAAGATMSVLARRR